MNAFEVLGLSMDADQAQVHAAYRSNVKRCHPDQFQEKEQQELSKQAAKIIKNSTKFDERGLSMLSNVAKVQNINLILNGLNFCATGIAFAFLLNKLESESNKITRQLNQLQSMIKQTQDIQNETIFNMVLADHTDMLDCQRKQQPYSEAQMRNLVDKEYNALYLLISSFRKGISEEFYPGRKIE